MGARGRLNRASECRHTGDQVTRDGPWRVMRETWASTPQVDERQLTRRSRNHNISTIQRPPSKRRLLQPSLVNRDRSPHRLCGRCRTASVRPAGTRPRNAMFQGSGRVRSSRAGSRHPELDHSNYDHGPRRVPALPLSHKSGDGGTAFQPGNQDWPALGLRPVRTCGDAGTARGPRIRPRTQWRDPVRVVAPSSQSRLC